MQRVPGQSTGLDAVRAARMGGFGFAFYGPYQHYWYKYLDKLFPTKSVPHFASKVWQSCTEHFTTLLGQSPSTAYKFAGLPWGCQMDPTCPCYAAKSDV